MANQERAPFVLDFPNGQRVEDILKKADADYTKAEIDAKMASKATTSDVERETQNLQNQINEIVRAPESGGDVSAEVAQARVDADGVTHITLKARCDSDADKTTQLMEDLSKNAEYRLNQMNNFLADNTTLYDLGETVNSSISSTTGQHSTVVTSTRLSTKGHINIDTTKQLKVDLPSDMNVSGVFYYNADESFVEAITEDSNRALTKAITTIGLKPKTSKIRLLFTMTDRSQDIPTDSENNIFVYQSTYKRGLSFGDSIMYGAGNNGIGILDILSDKYGYGVSDYSVSGASCAYHDGRSHIVAQIQNAIAKNITPSFILIDGLSNDIVISELGTLDNSFDYQSKGYANFTSGLEYCFGLLKQNYPLVPIIYVLPHSSNARDYATELAFGNRAREICKKWSVPIVDVYANGNFTARVTEQLQAYTDYPNENTGTHPNQLGYEKGYIPLVYAELKKIFD